MPNDISEELELENMDLEAAKELIVILQTQVFAFEDIVNETISDFDRARDSAYIRSDLIDFMDEFCKED
jgi:hypothetical protein